MHDMEAARTMKPISKEFMDFIIEERNAALDALQELCRRDCDWAHGFYDTLGSPTLHDALDVLVRAGRLEWVPSDVRPGAVAKDVTDEEEV